MEEAPGEVIVLILEMDFFYFVVLLVFNCTEQSDINIVVYHLLMVDGGYHIKVG